MLKKQRELYWAGDSWEKIKGFPDEVQKDMGYALHFAQKGAKHPKAKPLKGFNGVFEIVSHNETGTFRVVYAIKISDDVHVLHAFQKKSKKDIETPKKEVELIRKRLKDATILSRR